MTWMLEVDVADEAAWMTWDDGVLEGVPEAWQHFARRRLADPSPLYPCPEGSPLTVEADRAAAATLEAGRSLWGDAWQGAELAWSGDAPLTDPSYYWTPEGTIP